MAQWRIRVVVPDGPDGHQALESALAQVQAVDMKLTAPGPDGTEAAGDFVVELHEEESLGDLLRTLHEISPQVFISRVPSDQQATAADPKVRVRRLRRMAGVAG